MRAQLRAALRQTALWTAIPAPVWQPPWGVDCRPVGHAGAALRYLAPYSFRVALRHHRMVRLADDQVTFRDTVGPTRPTAACTLPVQAVIRRFRQHGWPTGFDKVRYDGVCRVGPRRRLARWRSQVRRRPHSADRALPAPPTAAGRRARVLGWPSCGPPLRLERIRRPHKRGEPARADQRLQPPPGMGRQRRARVPRPLWFRVPCRGADAHARVRYRRSPSQCACCGARCSIRSVARGGMRAGMCDH